MKIKGLSEKELNDFMPVQSLSRKESKRPAIFLRFKPQNPNYGTVRVHPGKLNVLNINDTYREIPVTNDTSVEEVMIAALNEFGLDSKDINRYRLVEVSLEKGGMFLIIFYLKIKVKEFKFKKKPY